MQGADMFLGLSAGSSVIDPGDRRPTAHFRRVGDRLRRGAGQPSVLSWPAWRGPPGARVARQPVDLGQYCEQLERRVGKAHEVMHLMIHKAKDCTRLVFTEKRAGRGKSERGDRHDRLMSDDDRPISSLDRLLGTEIDSNLLAVTKQPRLAGGSVWRSSRPKSRQHVLVPVPVPSLPRRLRWRLWHRAGSRGPPATPDSEPRISGRSRKRSPFWRRRTLGVLLCPATNTVPDPHVQSEDVATRTREPFRGLGVAGRQPCSLLTFSLRDTSRPVRACPMRVQ
jgi:hypothetical protein